MRESASLVALSRIKRRGSAPLDSTVPAVQESFPGPASKAGVLRPAQTGPTCTKGECLAATSQALQGAEMSAHDRHLPWSFEDEVSEKLPQG